MHRGCSSRDDCSDRSLLMASQPSNIPKSSRTRLYKLVAAQPHIDWQACEPRLVLSAQLLSDVIDPLQLQQHGMLASQIDNTVHSPSIGNEVGSAPGLEPTSAAHDQTGWTSLQQEFGLKGTGQTVAVIDSGVAWDHVALGKGFGSGYRVVGGWDFAENDSNPYDDGPVGFHGTHVSGIIGSDSTVNPGVAPDVDLVGLRVFNDQGQGQVEWVEQALAWVHTHRNAFANPITTVNLSLGTTWNADTVPAWGTFEDELKQLYEDGIVVTASAGNSFKQYNSPGLSYPAASSYVLPVASVDDNGMLSDFSQRSDRVLAAPGKNILSTVPDHVLGRDGKINDFSTASGTSMAAPYVAGASVLVREAMEMVGIQDISPARIINWLHDTAGSTYDSLTKANYDRLDLQNAIDSLLPDDNVGDTSASAMNLSLSQRSQAGWINHLGDQDIYKFTAQSSGQLTLDAESDWVDSLKWSIVSNGQSLFSESANHHALAITAGQSYELRFSADQEIGPFQLNLNFQASVQPVPTPTPSPAPETTVDLGTIDYTSRQFAAGSALHATAMHDGIFTVQWDNPDSAAGSLSVRDARGTWYTDATWSDGKLRLDIPTTAGQAFDIQLPGQRGDNGIVSIADIVQQQGSTLVIRDTNAGDNISLDLSHGISVKHGLVQYDFTTAQFNRISIDGTSGSDQLSVISSQLADRVEMRPGLFVLENTQLQVNATSIETVSFDSGTGVEDRLGMYDSDGDDMLITRADGAEMTGLGYKFTVSNMDRFQVNSTGQGQDVATLYDSSGDDTLSVRPEFTSLRSDHYFVAVRGFERVFVYATQGGYDTADVYDSSGDDQFSASGEAATIVGPGYHSYTKFFEQVNAHATAGGRDLAQLYGANQQSEWQRANDFVSLTESQWSRSAQGFEQTNAFVNGLAQSIPNGVGFRPQAMVSLDQAATSFTISTLDVDMQEASSREPDTFESETLESNAAPMISAVTSHVRSTGETVGEASRAALLSAPSSAAPLSASNDADMAAQLLLEVADLHATAHLAVATDSLHYMAQAAEERKLLDDIFSEYGSL